jgi:broad specificity phosphatase PhoE
MLTRILLVRHGATPLSAEDRFSGASDPPLSAEGLAQATAMGARLRSEPIAAAFTSPMQRALHTATIITQPRDIPLIQEPGLREIDHGHWEGLRQHEVHTQFADEYAQWAADPLTFAPPGGETGLSVLARSLPVLRRIVAEHAGQCILIVSHKATIRLLAAAILGLDPRRYRDRLASDLASLSVFTFEGFDRGRLERWNQAP